MHSISKTRLALIGLSTGCLMGCAKAASSKSTSATSSAVLQSVSKASADDLVSSDTTAGNLQFLAVNEVLPAGITDIVLGLSNVEVHVKNGSYVSILSTEQSLDLSTLTSNVETLVQTNVTAGSYDKVRLTFSSIAVTYENGDSMSYSYSSSSSSTSLDNQFVSSLSSAVAISSSSVTHLLLDIGAVAKAHKFGIGSCARASQQTALLPPFQIINFDATGAVGGVISSSNTDSSGTVTSAVVADAHVTVVQSGQPVASARTDANGNYLIFGLAPGSYDIFVDAKGFAVGEGGAVTIAASATSSEDVVIVASSSDDSTQTSNNASYGPGNPPPPPWDGGQNFDHP